MDFFGIPGLKFDMLRCDKEFVGDAADAFWLKDVKDVKKPLPLGGVIPWSKK